MPVPLQPKRIHGQCDFTWLREQPSDHIWCKQDVRVTADERRVHHVFRIHQRSEDVVLLPVCVVTEDKPRIGCADLVELVATDETNVSDTGRREGLEPPIENPLASHRSEAFRCVSGRGHQPSSPPGANNNRSHFGSYGYTICAAC